MPRCGSAFWGSAAGLPSQMAKATAKVDMTAWPAPVIKLFLGELTTEAALPPPTIPTRRPGAVRFAR